MLVASCRQELDQDPNLSRLPEEYYNVALTCLCNQRFQALVKEASLQVPYGPMEIVGENEFNESLKKKRKVTFESLNN